MPAKQPHEATWYYTAGEKQAGPVTPDELKALARNGQLRPTDMLLCEGMSDWILAKEVAGLFDAADADLTEQEREARRRGLFRDGKLLVVRKGVPLPPRCVKTNRPTDFVLKRTFYYLTPWVYLLILCHLLVFIVVGLILRKSVTLHVPLCEEAQRQRRHGILRGWILAMSAVNMIGVAIAVQCVWLGLVGGGVLVGGMVYGALKSQVLVAKRIDDRHAWLKGACEEYLAELPDWYAVRNR